MFQTIIQSIGIIFIYMNIAFIIARVVRNDSIVDIAWGIGFALITLYAFFKNGQYHTPQIVATILLLAWAARISGYIFIRNFGKKEDARYQQLKSQWGTLTFLYSYLFIFMLQGGLIVVIAYPLLLINSSSSHGSIYLTTIGAIVWLAGFLFETIADAQMHKFIKNPDNKQTLLRSGLWRYSRHPNYFGEALLWWGIFIIALGIPLGWSAIISPITITFLLLFVSGVPMAEKQIQTFPGFQEYKEETSIFIPWFVKK